MGAIGAASQVAAPLDKRRPLEPHVRGARAPPSVPPGGPIAMGPPVASVDGHDACMHDVRDPIVMHMLVPISIKHRCLPEFFKYLARGRRQTATGRPPGRPLGSTVAPTRL